TMLSLFAALALALAAFGLFGVMAYLVTERRHEFAVRLAIGARPSALAGAVFGQSFAIVGIGIVFGLGAAYGVSKSLPALLYGVNALEIPTLSIAIGVLALAAALAVGVPAWRAVRIDPIIALRQE
ncbi:MAG TPA: FtsX-like permease family protein, partial [Bryobacteraceae bacterium]|nr:FtsX-like permease family protein [Bryobacteraceae bacterium]